MSGKSSHPNIAPRTKIKGTASRLKKESWNKGGGIIPSRDRASPSGKEEKGKSNSRKSRGERHPKIRLTKEKS